MLLKKTIQSRDQENGSKAARAHTADLPDRAAVSFVPVIVAGGETPRPEEKREPVAEIRLEVVES
ncbi:MAG: hypothetical protein K8F91_01395 [Candidatus Obscuribacterales bacterium]|nr:hypothetical protein [Candidatus Obscuribacterales bacterium]